MMKHVLIIQTAFIGDVILATPVIEAIHAAFPQAKIDFLLRKGNENLLEGHPYVHQVIIWNKKQSKYREMLKTIGVIRSGNYDVVINLQRFLSTGIFTIFSGAEQTIGFSKNPLSVFFTRRYPHVIDVTHGKVHETDRNLSLLQQFIPNNQLLNKPRLYPSADDFSKVRQNGAYVTMSPTSVWFTKQYPLENWVKLINLIDPSTKVILLGGKTDAEACRNIKEQTSHGNVEVLAGKLSFLESAALMKGAGMNYVNDSAPLHLASAMDAPVTAIFCSTIPAFGFGPLSTVSRIAETREYLDCRPCGLHGYKACPRGHFKCGAIPPGQII